MKKLKLIVSCLFCLLIMPFSVSAASGSISVSGASTAVVGNKITVTVKLSTGDAWQVDLNYDKSYLQLVSGGGEAGGTYMVNTSTGNSARKYTFTFKALKKGNTTVKIGSHYVVAGDGSTVDMSAGSKSIKIMTQEELEASYSKDNNLKGLEVEGYEITPQFSKDVTEYSVNVPEGTETITIKTKKSDSKASVSGDGTVEVTPGLNTFNIIVKAENGSEKTYTLNVDVVDQNPINVEVDKVNYTVVKLRQNLVAPANYEESTVVINEFEIPAYYSEATKYTLVGLKNEAGEISYFIYAEGKYTKYIEVNSKDLILYPLKATDVPKGYDVVTIKINEQEVEAYKNEDNILVYGMNIINGNKGFYKYDKKEQTFQRFEIVEETNNMLYLTIALGIVSGLLLILLILVGSNSKKKTKLIKKFEELQNKKSSKKNIVKDENIIEEKKK